MEDVLISRALQTDYVTEAIITVLIQKTKKFNP